MSINSTRMAKVPVLTLVVAMVAAGCSSSSEQRAATIPPPPPVVEVIDSIPAHPDDGLYRFIVTPEPDSSDSSAIIDTATPNRWLVPPDQAEAMPSDATLVFEDGVPGYLDVSGSFVALDGSDQSGAEEPETGQVTPSFGHPAIDALAALDGVESITPIGDGSFAVVTTSAEVLDQTTLTVTEDIALGLTTDPYESYQWALDNTGHNLDPLNMSKLPVQVADADVDGAEAAAGPRGRNVVVAVVDTGVDFSHPDLAGSAWVNDDEDCDNGVDDDNNGYIDDCRGWDFAAEDNEPFVPGHHAHGTHVAGIIAATAGNNQGIAGLAPEVSIMDLSVTATGSMTTSSIARAIRYAVDNDADVVNLSLGTAPGVPLAAVTAIADAVYYAESAGVLLVIAAGNNGVDLTTSPVYPASFDASNVLAVGASTPADTKAGFSNYGQTVDLFAPGELILSTVPGAQYKFMSGTSQATPITTAIAALVIEQRPDADPQTVIGQLVGTADEKDAYRGLAATPVRLNAARAIGIDPDSSQDGSEAAVVTVRGLASATPDAVEASISLNAPGGQFEQPFHWEASLVAVRDEGVYGIIDHQVTINGVEQTTNERGAVELATGEASGAEFTTSLPNGTYALVIEAVPRTDSTVRLGGAYITTFVVSNPDSGSGGGTSDPGDSGGVTTTSTSSAPEGGGATTTSTTSEPGGGGTTTTSTTSEPGGGGTTTTSTTSGPGGGGATTTSTTSEPGGGGSNSQPPKTTSTTSPGTGGSDGSDNEANDIPGPTNPNTTPSTTSAPGSSPAPSPSPETTTSRLTTTTSTPTTTTSPPTTTTSPPTTTTSPPTTTTTSPGSEGGGDGDSSPPSTSSIDVDDGDWSITQISPRSGPVLTETMVSLTGHFPQQVYVWFGDSPAIVFFQSDNWILVRTPRQAAPGMVDVTLRRIGVGIVLTAPDAYTFLAADEEPLPVEADPGAPPTTSPGGGSDSGGGDETTGSDPAPAPTPGATTVPDSSPNTTTNTDSTTNTTTNTDSTTDTTTSTDSTPETTETDPSETDDQPRNQRQARATLWGDPIDLGNGLTGRALDGLSEVGGVPSCTSDPCRTQRIGADDGTSLQSSPGRGRFSGKRQGQRSGQKRHND